MAEKMEGKADADRRRFRQKVLGFMRNKHMTDRGDGVLAAVSGGADSVCLLLLLNGMAAELGIRVFAFHMNHGIRGEEADRDEQFVGELCKQLEIPLTVVHEKVETYAEEHGLSGEEAGRILRYRHLEETAESYQCTKIAVAHHEDDDAETVLLNLFRGSGLAGLSGIRPVRGKIIRPLLCVSRKEIEEYLKEQGFSWCEDSTNRENDYTRNKIRNELLPWVRENINSRAAEHILAVSMDFEINNLSYATKKEIVVLRDEFEEIQRQISNKNKEEKSEIRLAQLWINKYCYNRNGLVDVEEWKGLLSPWRSSIDCIKENISYCAQYSNYYKSIGIQKTSYNESGNKFAAADIFSDQLEETGYIYGTWGENFDFWIWGETTGFQYYKFNPEQEQWNEEAYTNEAVPTLLTEVQRSINQ